MRKVSEFLRRSMSSRLSRRPSALNTTVLTWRMLVSMPRPRTTICSSGITREKKRVEGSRRTCRVSLKKTARKPRKRSNTGRLGFRLVLIGQFYEYIFEAGSQRANLTDLNSVLEELRTEIVEVETIFDERVNRLAEDGGATNAGELARQAQGAGDLRLHIGKLAKRIGCAIGNEAAEINVRDVAAAFGFVHVMGGDEERDAVAGKLEEKIPELPARDRIDSGSGLVKEQELGFVEHGATEGQALLPSTGKLSGETIEIGLKTVELDDFVHAALQAIRRQAVDAAVELKIFGDGEIVVETETL